jgi:glycosyltransferase involved in cell wall biosynthesis
MKRNYIQSRNQSIQNIFDSLSLFRRKIIKEGTTTFWIYDRILKRLIFDAFGKTGKRSRALIGLSTKMLINQRFKVDPYLDWIISNEPLQYELEQQQNETANSPITPLFSIITPVYKPPAKVLESMLESVHRQTYQNWEHCLVNAAPEDSRTSEILQSYAQKDRRFVIQILDTNHGIAGNTNAAISMSKGKWVAFLDHDDQLAPFALYEVSKHINQAPEAEVIYSDEDKINATDQQRFSPFFKPDFNPDYLRGLNFMTHFFVVRKELGDAVGWLDSAYDGAQDFDLALKLVEKTGKIFHIPKILYHWRTVEGSTAGSSKNKKFAIQAGENALNAHIKRCGDGENVLSGKFPYQVRYPIKDSPKISIIIPNKDNQPVLKRLIDSIFTKSSYRNFEILIIENGSKDPDLFEYYETLKKQPEIKILQWDKVFNYSLVNNFGEQHASGSVILLLNNDLEVISNDWLERMLEHALRKEIGAVGAKLLYPNNTIQHAGVIVGMYGAAGHSHKSFPRESPGYYNRLLCVQNYSALTAACLMLRRETYQLVDGLDPSFKVEFGDVDFCLRILEHGFRNLWTPFAELYHHESLTRGGYDSDDKRKLNKYEVQLFQSRWAKFLEKSDPCYSPNLTTQHEDFGF